MDLPAVRLHLTQGDRSLEDHTTEFLELANHTHNPDSAMISFFCTGLNGQVKQLVPLSTYSPRGKLEEWLLIHSGWGGGGIHQPL